MFCHTGMAAVPERRDSHASSSREPSLEPTPTRSVDLGKHSVHTHFPKDRNCEICKRTKITRAPCRRRIGGVVHRAENFGDLITAAHKVLSENCESRNNHRCAVMVQDLATQWIQSNPCKTKTSRETQRSLQKFLEPDRKPEVIYTDNSLEFGKSCEDLSWNHCTSTPHRSETNGIAERAVRRVMEGTRYCCRPVRMKSGRQILWNVTPICETFKISFLMGKLHTKGVLENHLKDQSFRLVHWLSVTLSLRRTSQESINLERKFYLDCSSDTRSVRGWNLEGWHNSCRRWGVGNDGRIRNLLKKDSMRKRWYFPKKQENSFFQSQMDESNLLEEIRNWEHPPWYGNTQFEEKVEGIFLENQKGLSLHHLKTHLRMPVKR